MFNDMYRLSSHAVITNDNNEILIVKATYAEKSWGLPGGALDVGETVHEALIRECDEELGVDVNILYLSGIYYHNQCNSHCFIFRCEMPANSIITLSDEHSEWRYTKLQDLSPMQQRRVGDCLDFDGAIKSASFK